MRNACWITKATDTHSVYVILIAFPRQQWLRERSSTLTLYVHCLPVLQELTYSPEKDAAVVACRSVLSAPGKALLSQAEVLGHCEDREGQSSNQCLPVALTHLPGAQPREPLIEIDVIRPVVLPCCCNKVGNKDCLTLCHNKVYNIH